MTERERLIELIRQVFDRGSATVEEEADYLLEHGVIVPPCKVGDVVYVIPKREDTVILTSVEWVLDDGDDITMSTGVYEFNPGDIGTSVYFTHEEAEAALAKRREG